MRIANRFKDDETIFYEGEKPPGLYVVCRGKTKIYKSGSTGHQLITRIESPGDLLGHRSLLATEAYSGNAQSLGESVISLIPQEKFFGFLKRHPDASLALLKELSKDVRRGEDKARDIAFKPARCRLAQVLLQAKNEESHPEKLRLKRKELAEMAGLSIETTVRLLKDFEKKGLIRRKGPAILLLNQEKIQSLSGS